MVVVHHYLSESPAPGSLGHHHLLGKCDGQRPDRLHGETAGKVSSWIGLVELLGEGVRRRPLVEPDELRKTAENDISGLHHQVPTDGITAVCQPLLVTRGC